MLRGDVELLTLDDGGDDFLEGCTDFVLVLVDQGSIDVSVSIANGVLDLSDAMIRVCGLQRDDHDVRRARLPWAQTARYRGRAEGWWRRRTG